MRRKTSEAAVAPPIDREFANYTGTAGADRYTGTAARDTARERRRRPAERRGR